MPSSDSSVLVDEASASEIAKVAVDKEKQSILAKHQEMCGEAEIRVANTVDDGRLAIIGKTDECCDGIDEHGQTVHTTCADSCETLQTDVACLGQALTLMEKAAARISSVSKLLALGCERLTIPRNASTVLGCSISTYVIR